MFDMISPEELERRLGEPGAFLIDLRREEAYRSFHIEGAVNLPYDRLQEKTAGLPRRGILLLYCERGPTSFAAARELESLGYRTAVLAGGIRAWKRYKSG